MASANAHFSISSVCPVASVLKLCANSQFATGTLAKTPDDVFRNSSERVMLQKTTAVRAAAHRSVQHGSGTKINNTHNCYGISGLKSLNFAVIWQASGKDDEAAGPNAPLVSHSSNARYSRFRTMLRSAFRANHVVITCQ